MVVPLAFSRLRIICALFFLEASVIEESRSQSAIVMVSRNGESGPTGEPDCMHDNRVCLSSQKPGTRSRCLRVGIDSGPSARHILSKPIASNMPSMTVQETVAGTEAGKLQTELRDVFSKILGHARRIDMTLALGDTTEALGQVRELELYLERGLVVLSRPLTQGP